MKGNKLASFLVTVVVLVVLVRNAIAKNIHSVQKDEASQSQAVGDEKDPTAQVVENINNCLEQCQPQDPRAEICPAQCVMKEVATQKALLQKIITDHWKIAQGIFCIVGCEGSRLCHDVNTLGEFLRIFIPA